MQNKQEETVFRCTSAVLNNSSTGKALANKGNKILSNIFKSHRTPECFPKEQMTLSEVKTLYSSLNTLESKVDLRKSLADGSAPSETILWYTLGGQAGLAWCRNILKSQGILKSYKKEIKEEELNQTAESRWNKAPVMKAANDELMQVTYVCMQAGVDLHGDLVTEEDVRVAKESFNKSMMRANLFHMTMTDTFEIIESYLAPTDMILNEHFVQKGTWLCTLQVLDEDLWTLVKSGEISGISIGAVATVENLE